MTNKFGSRVEDVEERLNEFLELVRRYDESFGTDPVLDQVKEACNHVDHAGVIEDSS